MKRNCIISIITLLILSSNVFCEELLNGWFQDITPDSGISFRNNEITFTEYNLPPIKYKTNYRSENIDGISFIDFNFDYTFQVATQLNSFFNKGNQRWLILYGRDFLYAYTEKKSLPIKNGIMGRATYNIVDILSYDSDSFLTEGDTEYKPENLGNIRLSMPWVEGENDSGIGIKIRIQSKYKEMKSLMFSNGYVSYEKPYLYKYNNRVKRMQITSDNSSMNLDVELDDTPQLQFISLGEAVDNIEITIKDVYKGSKWDDTCINFIIPLSY